MKYNVVKSQELPAYLQLYSQIREDIVNGIYPFGSKLPSKRVLASETDVSTITIEHSYALLCDEGYIESRERSGYYVIFQSTDGFASVPTPRLSSINHTHTEEDEWEFPFSVLAKTMRKVISDRGESILNHSPNLGCSELREAIRMYLAQSRGIMTTAEQIVIGSGSEYLYTILIELLGRDRIYAIEYPSYEKIEQVYSAAEVQLIYLPLVDDGIDTDALKSCTADVLHISPYRSYPSGVTASASKRHDYLRWSGTADRYIIEDDFESEFSVSKKPEETLYSHSVNQNVIYMNSFSKTISPSLRISYMVLPEKLVPIYSSKLGFFSCTVPTYVQYVLAELINNGDFERHINRVRRNKRKKLCTK